MHNDDTTLVIVEYEKSSDFSITHQDNIVEMIDKEKLTLIPASHEVKDVKIPQDNPFQEKVEAIENFVVVQNNEKDFINDFQTEYQRCLQKKFPKQMGKLKYKWTQKAVEEALTLLFERYSVIKK